jgi:2-amino-4-hydroxy-6-hydroxymethyldihydropteridine diphosphokinase
MMILIAVGANLQSRNGSPPLATCVAATEALRGLPGLRVQAVSRWYATAAVPASDQPDYVNGVVRLAGDAEPAWLLASLQRIEAQAGRVRSVANAARSLDLDIIAIGDLVRDAPDPILPHPRAHQRAFVLRPLIDVAPEWRHPVLGRSAAELLAGLTDPALASQAVRPV